MGVYFKRPQQVEAFRWTGDQNQTEDPEWIVEAIKRGTVFFESGGVYMGEPVSCRMCIRDPGMQIIAARPGDWIIKEEDGTIHRSRHDDFIRTYQPAGVQ